jgi:amino acid permease
VAEVVGTGVLALGGAFSKVGWISGFVVVTLGFVGNVFTSLLLNQVQKAYPEAITLGDALDQLLGRFVGMIGYTSLYTYLFFVSANYVIVLSTAVQSVVYTQVVCKPLATAIGCALLLPGNQLRTLADISLLGAASFMMILATIVVCCWTLLGGFGSSDSCSGTASSLDFLSFNSNVSAFVFAYAGQAIMLEMQAEMKAPEDFPKSAGASFTVLFVVYTVVASAAYHACGIHTPGELLLVLPDTDVKACVGVMMVIHLIVSYTILQQVLTRATCLRFVPKALESGCAARAMWFVVSTGIMCIAYVLANAAPLFSDIVNITGAFLGSQMAFIFPTILYLAMYFKHPEKIEWQESTRNAAAAFAFASLAIGIYLIIIGTIGSVSGLVQNIQDGVNPPFECSRI